MDLEENTKCMGRHRCRHQVQLQVFVVYITFPFILLYSVYHVVDNEILFRSIYNSPRELNFDGSYSVLKIILKFLRLRARNSLTRNVHEINFICLDSA